MESETAMRERQRLGVQDSLWLEMDRPSNLMVVDSLVWTETPLDWERFECVARERLWDRYPVFRSAAVRGEDGAWYWECRPDFEFDDHITHLVLPAPGGDAELRQLIAAQRTVALDRARPLWLMYCVDGFKGGSAIVTRTHHAMADGIRMVQLAMSLFDATPDGGAILGPAVQLHAEKEMKQQAGPAASVDEQLVDWSASLARELAQLGGAAVGTVAHAVAEQPSFTIDRLKSLGWVGLDAAGRSIDLATTAVVNPVGAAHTVTSNMVTTLESLEGWLRSALHPRLPGKGPLVDLVASAPGDVDLARKLLLGTRNDVAPWSGPVGAHKAVAWSPPLALADVKTVARAHGVTVNDVLVTCVAGTLHAYLARHGSACASVNWMIPVNLKPLATTLPEQLGNSFAIVQLEMPTDIADPLEVLAVVHRRMTRIKAGHEAVVAFRVQELLAGVSRTVYRATTELLANRAVGVLTNVPGPPVAVYLAGTKVAGMVAWAPLSGDQPMSFTIYSYDQKVFVGIACDAGLVPDHEQIVDGFADAFKRLSSATR
jgi:diacylglycerol O-acyltransferase